MVSGHDVYPALFLTHDLENGLWYSHLEDETYGNSFWESPQGYKDYRDAELAAVKELWTIFGNVPCRKQSDMKLCIDEPFLMFEIGTNREDIWHWFEDTLNVPVAYLMGQVTDPTFK